jgi:hypothetical protein
MLSVANMDYATTSAKINIDLPVSPSYIASSPWGSVNWELSGKMLSGKGVAGLSTSLIILEL